MVLLHSLRVYRSILRGKFDRAGCYSAYQNYLSATGQKGCVSAITGKTIIPLCSEGKCKLYMGIRMADMFGHINNSRYIEALELARWHHMTSTGLFERASSASLFPVVASVNVQYIREIKPCSTVVIRTQIAGGGGRNMLIYQQIESQKGDVIHATGIIRAAWLNTKGFMAIDGSKPNPGPVPIEDVLRRLGSSEDETKAFVDGIQGSDDEMNQYFGVPLSSYDKKIGKLSCGDVGTLSQEEINELKSLRSTLSLKQTFPPEKLKVVNDADTEWRSLLRKEVRDRRAMVRSNK